MRSFLNLQSLLIASILSIGCATVSAHDAPKEKQPDPKQVVEDIYHKCMSQAHQIRDEEVCKARKPSIQECVAKVTKEKDAKTAKSKCELLFTS
jgi:hypothetical protein